MPAYQLTERFVREWNRVRRKVDTIRGHGVRNETESITIGAQATEKRSTTNGKRPIFFKRTTAISGQTGRYNGRSIPVEVKPNASGNLAAADLGAVPSEDNIIIWEFGAMREYRMGFPMGTDTASGKPIILAFPLGFFPVKVTQTGGGNGTKTTAATYTYTVKDLNDETLATSVSQSRPRPFGKVTAGASYGVAFWDNGTLVLWDAGEYPGSGGCP